MRFFGPARRTDEEERLLWSRDIRFTNRLALDLSGARLIELESGSCLVARASELNDALAAEVARKTHDAEYGLVAVRTDIPERDRYVVALAAAVQLSGIAERIGMGQSPQAIESKTLDYFFNLKNLHGVEFQPIVELGSGTVHEYECLFRPNMPMLPQTITAIVQAGIDTERSVELDSFMVSRILERVGDINRARADAGQDLHRFAVNVTPASLLAPKFEPARLVESVRQVGLTPREITIECTEQQSVADVQPLQRRAKELRRLGFGFAIDDAGAGYASFTLIAALRPSIIKIDRQIVAGIGNRDGDAKQALVEAFVSFGRRIGAMLVAEGIETRKDLTVLISLGVRLGQGYLLGRPAAAPLPPRRIESLREAAVRGGATARAIATAAATNPAPAPAPAIVD